jgi:hypothetical protein
MRLRSLALLLLFAAVPSFGLPPNLIVGGSFDTPEDLRNWRITSNKAYLDWVGVDSQSRPGSGSATVHGSLGGYRSQCVEVTPGGVYDFGARLMVTRGARKFSGDGPRAYVQISFWGDSLCRYGRSVGEAQTEALVGATGRFVAVSAQTVAPDDARGAFLTIISADENASAWSAAPTLFDDVFLQERGGCVPDEVTLCLAGGSLGATATYFDTNGLPHQARVVQLSTTSGYFYTNRPDDAELTMKMTGPSDGGGAKSFVIGGMTNLRLEILVTDWNARQVRRYRNEFPHFLSPIVDAFPAQ